MVRGGKIVGTIDMTPTWEGLLPMLLAAYVDGSPEAQRVAKEELMRLAQFADQFTAMNRKPA